MRSRMAHGSLFWPCCQQLQAARSLLSSLPYQRLKVCVYHERRFHLLMMVCKRHFVFSLFGQLCSCGPFQQPFAFGFVSFKQLCCCVAVQTSFTKMFAVVMHACFRHTTKRSAFSHSSSAIFLCHLSASG